MKKVLGISGLFLIVFIATAVMKPDAFLGAYNLENLIRLTALYGIISIGVALVIITGGIDLSVGSMIGLIGCLLPWLLIHQGWSAWIALPMVLCVSVLLGLLHGVLITKLKLQPFIVTLCGLLIYRGIARWFTADQTQGYGQAYDESLKLLVKAKIPLTDSFGIPMPFVILIVIATLAAIFLNRTIWGRYLLALGRNEEAARYSGINTDRMVILAYVLCGLLTGLGGVLFSLDVGAIQPAGFGNFYELYAIAAAVLGGCSLRGGEGSILGVVIGQAILRVLYNSINILGIPTQLEYAIIGLVILAGVIVDELVKRLAAKRRSKPASTQAPPTAQAGAP